MLNINLQDAEATARRLQREIDGVKKHRDRLAARIKTLESVLLEARRSITANDADMGDLEPRPIVKQIDAALAWSRT